MHLKKQLNRKLQMHFFQSPKFDPCEKQKEFVMKDFQDLFGLSNS